MKDFPATLTLLLVAFAFAGVAVFTTHGRTLNGAGFAAVVLVIVAMITGWLELQRALARRD